MSDRVFRIYEPNECGKDGYPLVWHGGLIPVEDFEHGTWIADYDTKITFKPEDGKPHPARVGVKHIVRMLAGHRCVRCLHPYECGVSGGEWSSCDERCAHGGPVRKVGDGYGEPRLAYDPIEPAGVLVGWGNHMQARYRILTVHHLRLGNDAKRDLRWWNLAALCQRCHLQIQGKVQMERIWPYAHSEWFKPYAAGWYAWIYLGLDLTRGETEARLDELLGLELAA